nr:MAG: RNA dependent RNA polymerase [Leviviridae sp.]
MTIKHQRVQKKQRQAVRPNRKAILDVDGIVSLTSQFCETINTPLSMRLFYIAQTQDWPKLHELELNPMDLLCDIIATRLPKGAVVDYDAAQRIERDVLVTQWLKKYPFVHENLHPVMTAKAAFIESEVKCRATNEKFEAGYGSFSTYTRKILFRAAQIVASILEPYRPNVTQHLLNDWGAMEGEIGKKATVGNHGAKANVHENVNRPSIFGDSQYEATKSLLCATYDTVAMRGAHPRYVRGSKVDFVPKTSKTHRTICIEPTVNLYFQAALGEYIRKQLLTAGIDLRSQVNNQRLAVRASAGGGYATLDLSAASDSISYMLVLNLLPPDWFDALDRCRTPYGVYKDKGETTEPFMFEKFSSMGNGFTFPLETLIFYALAKAVAEAEGAYREGDVLAYGDDIIVPTVTYWRLVDVLEECGFSTNKTKSFSHGPYRESCGAYSVRARHIQPVRISEPVKQVPDMYRICNAIFAQALASGGGHCLDRLYRDLYRHALSFLTKAQRLTGPALIHPDWPALLSVVNTHLYDAMYSVERPKFRNKHTYTETVTIKGYRQLSLDSQTKLDPNEVKRTLLYLLHRRRLNKPVPIEGYSQGYLRMFVNEVSYTPEETRQFSLPRKEPGPYVQSSLMFTSSSLRTDMQWL